MSSMIRTETHIKSHRLKSREPIDQRCQAFMKELRERHKGKMIYSVNPYAEVYPVREGVYAIFTESLDGAGDVWSYLITGEKRAMLVDTGFGVGDLKGLCGLLCGDRELIVVNTHPHIDHAYGNCQFERVFCHEYAVPRLKQMHRPDAWDHLFDETGKPIWAYFDRADIVPFQDYEIIGVPDGYTFDLGNDHQVELIFTAGHSSGHCMFLDKKKRLLFAGDDVISMRIQIGGPMPDDPFGDYATVRKYQQQMKRLAGRKDEFDSVFPGHFVFDLENYVVEDLAAAAGEIINDPSSYDYEEDVDTPRGPVHRFQKFVPGLGTLAYTEAAI